MGDSDFIVALVALIVSVIALIVTAFQLSAQIFSTAEGQRKCSESLLSVWSKDPTTKSRWKWRWSEARFELKFVTPEICLGTSASPIPADEKGPLEINRSQFWTFFPPRAGARRTTKKRADSILGADSRLDYILFMSAFADNAPDMVSWLSFLTGLRLKTGESNPELDIEETLDTSLTKEVAFDRPITAPLELSWPRVKYRVHSWDYMPPNAPKPFAKFTIHDIAVLVRRLGMVWKTFDPKNGNMSAEGGVHILTACLIQGLGLVLEYRCLDDKLVARHVSYQLSAICRRPTNPFTQSQMHALHNAQADALGLAPGTSRKPDEESQTASEAKHRQQYDVNSTARRPRIWVKEIDKFIFGLMPGDPRLGLPDYSVGERSDRLNIILSMLNEDESGLREKLSKDPNFDWEFSFNDMMTMIPPILKTRYSGRPQFLPFRPYFARLSVFGGTLPAFGILLRALLNGGIRSNQDSSESTRQNNPTLTEESFGETVLGRIGLLQGRDDGGTTQMKRVLNGVEDMLQTYSQPPGPITSAFFERMHEYHDSTTQYFIENKAKISLHELLKAFMSKAPVAAHAVFWGDESEGTYIFGCKPLEGSNRDSCILEHYFSHIPDYVDHMQKASRYDLPGRYSACSDRDVVIEAWLTLMWRGYLFEELHFNQSYSKGIESICVPREYYGSRLPVYMI